MKVKLLDANPIILRGLVIPSNLIHFNILLHQAVSGRIIHYAIHIKWLLAQLHTDMNKFVGHQYFHTICDGEIISLSVNI